LRSRRADELVAVHQGRLAVIPAGHHAAAEVLLVILAPEDGPLVGVEAGEIAIAAEGKDAVAIDHRRAARPVAAASADGSRSQLLARFLFDANDVSLALGALLAFGRAS